MKASRSYNRLCTVLAICAMTMSFMANITPLWANSDDGTPIVICTAFGSKTITIDENGQEVPTPQHLNKRCTMCLVADENLLLQQSPTIPAHLTLEPLRCAFNTDQKHPLNTFSNYTIRGPPTPS